MKNILLLMSLTSFLVGCGTGTRADDHIEEYSLEHMLEVPVDSLQDIQGALSGQNNAANGIADARALYWKAYKTGGSDFQAAKANFSTLLFIRDQIALFFNNTSSGAPRGRDPGSQALERFMPLILNPLTYAPSEQIPASAENEFDAYSDFFHKTFRGNISDMNVDDIKEAWLNALRVYYPSYLIARNWAEEAKAPFPLPIEVYLYGMVQRWPYPTNADNASADYRAFLTLFGKDRVFEIARKVQAAMDAKGHVDASLFGVSGTGRNALFQNHNPYEVLWMVLTKDNPDSTKFLEFYRSRDSRVPLQLLIDQWKSSKAPQPSDPVEVEKQERAKLEAVMSKFGSTYVTIPMIRQMLARDNDPKNNVPIAERIKHLRAQTKLLKERLGDTD
jgi:hypothetical protein